jgi:tetratricopeptide (TPR) repeat protein
MQEEPEITRDARQYSGAALGEPAFVGRKRELDALGQKLGDARSGAGGLAALGGESGAGKTRLLDEFARASAETGAWVLRGYGRGMAAARPYQVLEGVVSAVATRAVSDEQFAGRLRARLRGYESAIVATMPRLAMSIGYDASDATTPEAYGEIRSRRALTVLLAVLGTADRPALVLLDDCQWADELTFDLLQRWPEHVTVSGEPVNVLIVAAYRTEDVASEHRLESMPGASQILLPMLAPEEMDALVASMASGVPEAARDVVERVSGGSPFMAAEVLRGMVETGVLVPLPRGWSIELERLADAQSSEKAARFLSGRFDQLSPSTLDLLSAGAVLGRQFELDPARELARQSLGDARAALAEASSRHMVWFDADAGHWTFMHDQLREGLLARLSEDERRDLHRIAATVLAVEHPDRVFELAYHFDAAGEPERALPYALEAAVSARGRYALEIATRYYRIAGRGVDPRDRATRLQISEGLGDVAMLRGDYVEAGEQLTAAAGMCEDDFGRAAIEGKLGELAFKRGDVDTSVTRLHNGLRLLGQRVPRTRFGYLWALMVQVFVQAGHTLAPRLFVGRRTLEGAERELLTVRLLSELSHAYWFRSGLVPCGWAHLREMNLAERYPTTPELAQAYSEHAPVMTMIPWYKRGVAYAQRSIEIRHELGDAWDEAQSRHFLGIVLYSSSRFEEALESCRLAVETLEHTGDQWEVNTAKWHIAFSLYRLGRLRDAVDMSREVHRAAVAIGDAQSSGISLGAWSKAIGGAIPEEPVRAALATLTNDVHTSAEVLQAEAIRQLAAGEPLAAVEALQRADQLVRHAGLRQEYVAPVTPWLATALRRAAAHAPDLSARERRRLARRARRAARRGRRIARSYRNNLPHALREKGLLAASAGHPRRARRALDKSMQIAEQQGASYEHAQSAVAMGNLAIAQGWPDGEAMLAQGTRVLAALAAELSPGVGEGTTLAL